MCDSESRLCIGFSVPYSFQIQRPAIFPEVLRLMPPKTIIRSFDDVLSILGSQKFDVAPASDGAKTIGGPGTIRVCKHGCAAEIAPVPGKKGIQTTEIVSRPGFVLGGEIARLLDRGYQKFLKTHKLEIPASADHLRAIHLFSEQLKEALGATSLYNESLGTTSDTYLYDRLVGRS